MNALALTMDSIDRFAGPAAMSSSATAERVAEIYDDHQRELFTFAFRACRDPEAAEDLVHEAFIRLIVEIDEDRMPRNVRAWLYRVVANLAVSRARRATVAQRQLGALLAAETEDGPEPAYLDRERRTDLDAVLGELDVDARTALLMAAGGFNGMEIAEAIGRTGGATRSLMCRTRLQLRERLGSTGWLT